MIVVTLCIFTPSLQQPWRAVDSALGRTGSLQGETYRVGFPRNDLHVTVGAVTVRPALAMLMGDLVLLESEAGPVIDALQRGGIEQTALHNHLVGETPHVMYLHVLGRGR